MQNIRESVFGTFKNICTVVVHCWYIKDASAGFCQQIFKKSSDSILGKIDKKDLCHAWQILAIKKRGLGGLGESVKKGKFETKVFFR